MARPGSLLKREVLDETLLGRLRALSAIARERNQTLAQMALAWVLRDRRVTSTIVGARTVAQVEENHAALQRLDFTADELAEIDRHAQDCGITLWPPNC